MQPSIYLAGPITGLTFGQSESWRDYVKGKLDGNYKVKCFSPLRAQEFLKDHGIITPHPYDENPMTTGDAIMTRDFWDVQRTDLTFANLLGAPRQSLGTVMELGFAYALRKPVILLMEKSGNVHDHAMVRKAGAFTTDNIDEGIELVKAMLFAD
jgi:nucleoside 2-deoxyribosyltransferase